HGLANTAATNGLADALAPDHLAHRSATTTHCLLGNLADATAANRLANTLASDRLANRLLRPSLRPLAGHTRTSLWSGSTWRHDESYVSPTTRNSNARPVLKIHTSKDDAT